MRWTKPLRGRSAIRADDRSGWLIQNVTSSLAGGFESYRNEVTSLWKHIPQQISNAITNATFST